MDHAAHPTQEAAMTKTATEITRVQAIHQLLAIVRAKDESAAAYQARTGRRAEEG